MSDQRRLKWRSGGLTSMPIQDGWAIDLDSRNPSIPNLPLETAAAQSVTWQQGTQAARAHRRHDADRRLLQAPVHPTTVTIEASTDSALSDPFTTRVGRSRRSLAMGWMAALATVVQAPVLPYAAVIGARSIRRRETSHRLVTVAPLHWPYIAPTVAAILKPERAKVIEFRTRLQITPTHSLFPPATGPPEFSFAAVAAVRAKRRHSRQGLFLSAGDILSVPTSTTTQALYPSFLARELPPFEFTVRHLREPVQPDYPQAQVTVSDDSALADPFVTRVQKRRKRPKLADVLGVGAAAPVTPYAPVSALTLHKARGRKSRQGLFLSSGDILSVPPTVAAVYPSFLSRTLPKYGFSVRLLREPFQPAYPQTPAVPEQPPTAWQAPRQFWTSQKRTLLPAAPQLLFPESPPVAQTPEGGGGWERFRWEFERERYRRKLREQEERDRLKEIRQIPDKTDREIARLLAEQEAKERRKAELDRLLELARKEDAAQEAKAYNDRVGMAYARALAQGNFSAIEALERELSKALDEEAFMLMATLLLEDQ